VIKFVLPEPTHLCINPDCRDREWNLTRLERGLWRLRSHRGVYTMGASQPACPICGASLLEITALEPEPEWSEQALRLETQRSST
jgi:hypothetical protein